VSEIEKRQPTIKADILKKIGSSPEGYFIIQYLIISRRIAAIIFSMSGNLINKNAVLRAERHKV
jgi:hypothetical protein